MSREIRLGPEVAEDIASRHDHASSLIEDSAAGMPEGVDGGQASDLLARIMAGVARTASGMADTHRAAGVVVRDVDGDFGETEAAAASTFRDMTEEIR